MYTNIYLDSKLKKERRNKIQWVEGITSERRKHLGRETTERIKGNVGNGDDTCESIRGSWECYEISNPIELRKQREYLWECANTQREKPLREIRGNLWSRDDTCESVRGSGDERIKTEREKSYRNQWAKIFNHHSSVFTTEILIFLVNF